MRRAIKALTLAVTVSISPFNYAQQTEVTVLSDIAYGTDPKQALDVYIPAKAGGAPVIVMVHGGGWTGGDKALLDEYGNKVQHWVNNGFVFVSVNYRTLPEADPITQVQDVKEALLFAQQNAKEWGGDPTEFILFGHSSGAHLASLLAATYRVNEDYIDSPLHPLLGVISLDSSAYNIVSRLTEQQPPKRYQSVFGTDMDYWQKASPFYSVSNKLPPFLAVCSIASDKACSEANKFKTKANSVGASVNVMPVDMGHAEINSQLGKASCYTQEVDKFIKDLSSKVKFMYFKNKLLRGIHECP